MRIHVADNAEALSLDAAEEFARLTSSAVQSRGRCAVALAGGSTPRAMYRALASRALRTVIPWHLIEFFWSDERHVPPDHADSNYRMAFETLLSSVPVLPEQIHRVRTESGDADSAAREYETEILATVPSDLATVPSDAEAAFPGPREAAGGRPVLAGVPRFDLILLGLGKDGHTASLFPGTRALAEHQRLCVANWVDRLGVHRITMTLPLLNAARTVLFLVSGSDKAAIVRDVLRPADTSRELPAQLVRPAEGELLWMLDRPAASDLGDRVP